MKKILILILLLIGNYLFAQPLTSTPAGCAITITGQNRVYQITTTSFGSRPTYMGTGGVRYTTWTTTAGAGVDQTRLPCITLNSGASNSCYVKTGTGTTAADYTSGTSTTFTVNPGTVYNESGIGTCTSVPIDDYIWVLMSITGFLGFFVLKNSKMIFS